LAVNSSGVLILYYVGKEVPYTISIYGVDGREVRRIKGRGKGFHRVNIKNIPGGIYF